VLKAGTREFGLVVDQVLNSEEIVVKPMHSQLRWLEMYSGATILGDGGIALILNAEGMARVSQVRFTADSELTTHVVRPAAKEQLDLLLVCLLDGDRAAIPVQAVRRVLMVPADACQRVAQHWYIQHDKQTLCVETLRLGSEDRAISMTADRLFVLVSRADPRSGFVVQDVLGTRTLLETDVQHLPHETGQMRAVLLGEGITPVLDLSAWVARPQPERNADTPANAQRILVVDDTEFFRNLVAKCLRLHGYEVMSARDGAEALELLRREPFDLVVSDLEMPVLDGLRLAERIHQIDGLRTMPLLALTTLTGDEIQEQAVRHGFDAFEVKFDQASFVSAVRRLLQSSRPPHPEPGADHE
jgi:two-component system chemotaxis sensor kinase CheA